MIVALGLLKIKKIINESDNYLITFPIGANYYLQDYIMNSSIPYVIMRRKNIRGETNNWVEDNNPENFYFPCFYFDYCCDYFGCGAAIVIVTNQPEVFNKKL